MDKFYTNEYQIVIFDKLQTYFKDLPEIIAVIQRGSGFNSKNDTFSDIDLLLIVEDSKYIDFINKISLLLKSVVDLITNVGWYDSIVPNFGGLGLCYFIKYKGKLIQLDIYIVPNKNSYKILNFKDKKIIYTNKINSVSEVDLDNHEFIPVIKNYIAELNTDYQIYIEPLLLTVIYIKQIMRLNIPLCCKYNYAVKESLVKLFRFKFTPDKLNYKFYDLKNDFENSNNHMIYDKLIKSFLDTDIISKSEIYVLLEIYLDILKVDIENTKVGLEMLEVYSEVHNYVSKCLISNK